MSIFDGIKNLFAGEKAPGEQYKKDVEATHKQMQKMMANEKDRRDHITKCVVLMKECRTKFNTAIMTEQGLVIKKKRTGFPTDRERTRIHEAAIGILTVDMALFDLESIVSEADLSRAMNNMGKALRQLIRLDNSTASISGSARKFIDMFYPSFKNLVDASENYTAVKKAAETAKKGEPADILSIYEIPPEIRARINDNFVDNLMEGDSYEMAMFKAQHSPAKESKADAIGSGSITKEYWDRINELAQQEDDGSIINSRPGL